MIDISNQQIIDLLRELPTKKDLVVLKAEITSEITAEMATKKDLMNLKSEITQEFDSKLAAQEIRIKTDLTRVIEIKIGELQSYIETNVGTLVEDAINPILDNHNERLMQLEKKTGVPTIPMKPLPSAN